MTSITFDTADALGLAAAQLADSDRAQLLAVAHEDGGYVVTGPDDVIAALTGNPSKERLIAHAAAKRWRVETGGITVSGVAVATDDRSKMMIIGARSAAIADADWTTDWIGADGTIHRLDAAAMIAISDAVQAHVGAAFSAYAAILAAIEAGTMTTFAAIDDAAAWPR